MTANRLCELPDADVSYDPYDRFYQLLDASALPSVAGYWIRENNECDVVRLKKDLKRFSHGESIMARFYLSVWCGKCSDFDICEAAEVLDARRRKIIAVWLADPFWV